VVDADRARRVVKQLIADRPRGYLATLLLFYRLLKLDQARHSAVVESATPLPEDQKSIVESGLKRIYGAGLNMAFAENRALIGGMRIRVSSDVYDGSVRARLDALEQSF
jgi:F-type H+-transporting ATPase subunit delta